MAGNKSLGDAKKAKNDEFYTQFNDIQKEVNAYIEYNPDVFRNKTVLCPCDDPDWSNFTKFFALNFNHFGLKKLISTSYAYDSKHIKCGYQLSLFEEEAMKREKLSPQYDPNKTKTKGKIFVMERINGKAIIPDVESLKWEYLNGDGDFRDNEIRKLLDEADVVSTNPPFSLFREFIAWIMNAGKKFLVIGNQNAITYKEIFPLIKENKIWLGNGFNNGNAFFAIPKSEEIVGNYADGVYDNHTGLVKFRNARWFTNIEHGKRHEPSEFMTMKENLMYSKHKAIKEDGYCKYDNYNAIEVPFVDAIPGDYDGVMGVPVTFLDQYCPEQFEILGSTQRGCHDDFPDNKRYDDYWEMTQEGKRTGSSGVKTNENPNLSRNDGKHNYFINKEGRIVQSLYSRLFIRKRKNK